MTGVRLLQQVSLHAGAPNKNIGDAFLLVWKFPKTFSFREVLPHLKEEEKNAPILRQPSVLNLGRPQTIVAPGQELDSLLMLQTVTICPANSPSPLCSSPPFKQSSNHLSRPVVPDQSVCENSCINGESDVLLLAATQQHL